MVVTKKEQRKRTHIKHFEIGKAHLSALLAPVLIDQVLDELVHTGEERG